MKVKYLRKILIFNLSKCYLFFNKKINIILMINDNLFGGNSIVFFFNNDLCDCKWNNGFVKIFGSV